MMAPTADEVFAAADLIAKVTAEQGGCIETSRPTTHSDPTFVEGASRTTAWPTSLEPSPKPRRWH
jgi:hypothetical protein